MAVFEGLWHHCGEKPSNHIPGKGSAKSLSDKGKVENLGDCGRKMGTAVRGDTLEPRDFGSSAKLAGSRTERRGDKQTRAFGGKKGFGRGGTLSYLYYFGTIDREREKSLLRQGLSNHPFGKMVT